MREVVGFAAGVTVATGLGLLLRSEGGRRLLQQVVEEAEPELRAASGEWEPLLREVSRAVRLGVREAIVAIDKADGVLSRLADEAEAARAAGARPATDIDPTEPTEPTVGAAPAVGPVQPLEPEPPEPEPAQPAPAPEA